MRSLDFMIDSSILQMYVNLVNKNSFMREKDFTSVPVDASFNLVDGIAYIPMQGVMMKKDDPCLSMMTGETVCSTIRTRQMIRSANESPDVKSIVLLIDSPGGDVSGSFDLANDVKNSKKSCTAYVENTCCSGAYLVASQCEKIFTNENATVGSVGVYTVLVDESVALENAGIKVHLVKTGELKGMGADSTVSDEMIQAYQDRVDSYFGLFVNKIQNREFTPEQLDEIKTAKVFIGKQAIKVGLTDGIKTIDQVHNAQKRGDTKMSDQVLPTSVVATEEITKTKLQEYMETNKISDDKAILIFGEYEKALASEKSELQALAVSATGKSLSEKFLNSFDTIESVKEMKNPYSELIAERANVRVSIATRGAGISLENTVPDAKFAATINSIYSGI